MNLIEELQDAILDSRSRLSSVLRKAKVLASLLRNDEFKKWVDNELNGYQNEDEKDIPNYRKGYAESYGIFVGPYGAMLKNQQISSLSLPEKFRDHVNKTVFSQGVCSLESLVVDDSHFFHMQWPADILATVSNRLIKGYTCASAWKLISRGEIEQILDAVRNRLLGFVLALKEKHPEISESKEAISEIPQEETAQACNMYITGSAVSLISDNIITGEIAIDQKPSFHTRVNDLGSLLKYMEMINMPTGDIKELKKAVEEDGQPSQQKKFGPKVANWIGTMAKKIAEGTWNVAPSILFTLVKNALFGYYGWV